jgi:DNA-binding transcriptional LysR family regulator
MALDGPRINPRRLAIIVHPLKRARTTTIDSTMNKKDRNRSYKELTLQQLRCLCETARLGSFTAAATALEVSHPTVLQQVRALEREFGAKLVEPHERGCVLTAAGRLLIELAGPPVEAIATLREQFRAGLGGAGCDLTIATTPRVLLEDLAQCMAAYCARWPGTQLTFIELDDGEVAGVVESRRADFGLTPSPLTDDHRLTLTAEPVYRLEVRLVARSDHPLARRRAIHPRDLKPYPFVNGPGDFSSSTVRAILDRHGAYEGKPHAVRASFAASIRRFVSMGMGIGLLPSVPSTPPHPGFFERSMSRHFGHIPINLLRRRGAFLPPAGEAFLREVRDRFGTDPAPSS